VPSSGPSDALARTVCNGAYSSTRADFIRTLRLARMRYTVAGGASQSHHPQALQKGLATRIDIRVLGLKGSEARNAMLAVPPPRGWAAHLPIATEDDLQALGTHNSMEGTKPVQLPGLTLQSSNRTSKPLPSGAAHIGPTMTDSAVPR